MNNYHRKYFLSDPHRDVVWEEISKYIQQFIPESGSILELGAGYCNFINKIKAKNKTAIDLWPGFKKYANKEIKTISRDLSKGLGNPDSKFDVVFASNFFEHIERKRTEKLLLECKNVLKPNGKIILIQPNFKYSFKNYFDDYTHREIYTDISLSGLLAHLGFSICHVEPKFIPFSLKSRLPKSQLLIRYYLRSPLRPFAGQMLIVAKK
jgi:SAM-dependent methyltransferase